MVIEVRLTQLEKAPSPMLVARRQPAPDRKRRLSGVSAMSLAGAWIASEEVWRYLEARCPVPSKAAELRKIGITPEMADEHYGYDEDDFPMTLGEAYCAGEMVENLEDIV